MTGDSLPLWVSHPAGAKAVRIADVRPRAHTFAGVSAAVPRAQALADALRTVQMMRRARDVQVLPTLLEEDEPPARVTGHEAPPRPATPPPSAQHRLDAAGPTPKPQPRPTTPPPTAPAQSPPRRPFARAPSGLRHSSSEVHTVVVEQSAGAPQEEDRYEVPEDIALSFAHPCSS